MSIAGLTWASATTGGWRLPCPWPTTTAPGGVCWTRWSGWSLRPFLAGAGRIAAEQITPYPPGIPAIVPGERINTAVIDYLLSGLDAGMVLPDPADPQLHTVRVIQ